MFNVSLLFLLSSFGNFHGYEYIAILCHEYELPPSPTVTFKEALKPHHN